MHLAPVLLASHPMDQALSRQSIYQLYCAVMLNLQAFRKIRDPWFLPRTSTLHRQHQLVLLRFQSHFSRCRLADVKKTPDLITKFRQSVISPRTQIPCLDLGHNP